MKRSASFILLAIQILCAFYFHAHACTGVKAKTSQGVLVGGNEDYNTTFKDVIIRVRPAAGDNYGYIGTGFQRHSFFMMGVNDQGLFIDMFTVPPNNYHWVPDPNKLNYNGFLEEKMLRECANVDEAIEFFHRYNNPSMVNNRYQIFVADSEGSSAVISWCDGIEVVRSDDAYQVVTNFFLNHTDIGWYPCWRYATASDMMADADSYSFDLIRNILGEVHLNSNYSQICDLSNGDIYIFYDHNFNESVRINVNKELKKGRKDYLVSDYLAQIELISPDDQDEILSTNRVTFEWEGLSDVQYYQLFISNDPNFSNCDPITILSNPLWAAFGFGINFLLLGIAFTSLDRKKVHLKEGRVFFLILLITLFCLCRSATPFRYDEPDPNPNPGFTTYQKTVKDLQKGQTYYWKIGAKVGDGIFCESKSNTFTLGE